MKSAPRGPFTRIRWFCNDGSILPPTAEACDTHGGGAQHGEYTERVKTMRADGYALASILSNLDVAGFLADPNRKDTLAQISLEQYLIAVDDGWILRQARFYRGAMQEEGERRGGRRLLFKMSEDTGWLGPDYLLLRTSARFIAHGSETDHVTKTRQRSTDLARRDPGFQALRNKIHIRPGEQDAGAVLNYAQNRAPAELVAEYQELAETIRLAYEPAALVDELQALAKKLNGSGDLGDYLAQSARQIEQAEDVAERFGLTADMLQQLRDRLLVPHTPDRRMALIDATFSLEAEHYAAATQLRDRLDSASRAEIVAWLQASAQAIYGAGLISQRQHEAIQSEFRQLAEPVVSLATYRSALDYLGRAPGWGTASLNLYFGEAMQRFATIEPLVAVFIQDQLRSSGLFFYAQAIDVLRRDAEHLAQIGNELDGDRIGGMRSLNPGFARGTLHFALAPGSETEFERNGIYVLQETEADLPPVAGIITAGEGNPLSHIQLLARNLGIPNVAVNEQVIERLRVYAGEQIVLAVSPAGSVVIRRDDEALAAARESEVEQPQVRITPDLDKLDLAYRGFPTLDELRSSDSGRIAGPKAAKLGELKHHFPTAVANGLVIPFGEFRALLDQPMNATGMSVFDWMVSQYEHLETLAPGSMEREEQSRNFRQRVETWILEADPGAGFRERLSEAMRATFGEDGTYGVFVRSDTNVEDLPGFTGAGLNLTLPNVVGVDAVFDAIERVWASPFSARAFAWRQNLMALPQHVYPAVLLQLTVPVEKSGVLVTRDIDTGRDGWLSIAVNEGVGGAVDGQAAESLRVNLESGRVRLLAQASTPWKRLVPASGGVVKVPVSGASAVLKDEEIQQLIDLAQTLPQRFPPIVDERGEPAPADIEFGFIRGDLRLFQIRPFLESARARNSVFLSGLDASQIDTSAIQIHLSGQPTR